MKWKIDFYNSSVEDEILKMPPKLQARMIKLLELIEKHGANLGAPHTEAMGNGLFEIRAKAQEGIGRALYCYMKDQHIIILSVFVKKTNKTPKSELQLALKRKSEVEKL